MINVLDYKKEIERIAYQISNKIKISHQDLDDIKQIAYIKAMRLAKSYNPNRGVSFKHYLNKYLPKNTEREYTKHQKVFTLPTHLFDKRSQYYSGEFNKLSTKELQTLDNYYTNNIIKFCDIETLSALTPIESNIDEVLDNQIKIKQIKKAIKSLEVRQQELMNRKFFSEKQPVNNCIIAKELGCSHQNVANIIKKAIKRIKKKVKGGLN